MPSCLWVHSSTSHRHSSFSSMACNSMSSSNSKWCLTITRIHKCQVKRLLDSIMAIKEIMDSNSSNTQLFHSLCHVITLLNKTKTYFNSYSHSCQTKTN